MTPTATPILSPARVALTLVELSDAEAVEVTTPVFVTVSPPAPATIPLLVAAAVDEASATETPADRPSTLPLIVAAIPRESASAVALAVTAALFVMTSSPSPPWMPPEAAMARVDASATAAPGSGRKLVLLRATSTLSVRLLASDSARDVRNVSLVTVSSPAPPRIPAA